MEATSDEPLKIHDQNGDVEKDASADVLLSSKELVNQAEDTAYNGCCVQHEPQSGTDISDTERKSSEKSPCRFQQGAVFSGKILSFCCSECKDDVTYSPNDLLKHFQGTHKGRLPTYPCDLCTFVTNEFSSLQRHRIGHRDTFVTCEICNDGVQYSLLLLTRHFNMCHSCNGLFRCKKCEFSTRDAGTFVQHIHYHNEGIHKCVKCPSLSSTQGKIQSGKVHSGTFPFTCQLCGYGAARREYLSKHMGVAHGDETERANKWKSIEDYPKVNSPGLKLLLKKNIPAGGSNDPRWMSKMSSYPGVGLLDHSGRLLNPEKTLEETQQFLERAVCVKKEANKWSKSPLKSEQQFSNPATFSTPQPKMQENDLYTESGSIDTGNSNGLTVLMVKNKISIPPNCTTKVMGFKMVDGKKHLVLKVIPTKQETTTNSDMSPNNILEKEEKTGSSPYSSLSERSGSLLSLESVTNKDAFSPVKIDKTQVEIHNQSPLLNDHKANVEPTSKPKESGTSFAESPFLCSTELTRKKQQSDSDSEDKSLHHDPNNCTSHSTSEKSKSPCLTSTLDAISHTDKTKAKTGQLEEFAEHTAEFSEESCTNLSLEDTSTGNSKCFVTAVSADFTRSLEGDNLVIRKNQEAVKDQVAPKIQLSDLPDTERKSFANNDHKTLLLENEATLTPFNNSLNGDTGLPNSITKSYRRSLQNHSISNESLDAKDHITEVDTVFQNFPNQEVFSFHNYSKETFGSSPDFLDADEHSQDMEEDESEEFDELKLASDWSLTLPPSPPLVDEQSEEYAGSGVESCTDVLDAISESENKSLERVSDSDIEVDECIATVEDLPDTVMTKTDKRACLSEAPKNEQDSISNVVPSGPASLNNSSVLGKILEQHSDTIISQQLEKERIVSSNVLQDTNRSTKTTLRILQMPEGKNQMFLQTVDSPYAVPVQLTSGQGFKLITKSCASKVNVSYVKPGIEMPSKGSGLSLTLNGGRIGMSAQSLSGKSKGQASLLQTVSGNGGRYFVSASALKRPLLLSGTVKDSSDQTCNMQSTCYLVQRPLPVSPSTESAGSTSKAVLATRPVLALPVKSSDKASTLQTGRQAYLVRYVSPAKSGVLLNSANEKGAKQSNQANEGSKSRVFLKIVRKPNGTRFLSTTPYTSANKPLYVAASSLQSPYLLMPSDWSAALASSSSAQTPTHKLISAKVKRILPQSGNRGQSQVEDGLIVQKSSFLPMHTRPRSQRKRSRRMMFEESFETSPKIRRISSKALPLKDVSSTCKPLAKDVERNLRLSPFNQFQQIKYPRQNQPVVVLNHPDADIPEVTNIMKSVNRYKGEVIKVALSQSTVRALSEWSVIGPDGTPSKTSGIDVESRVRPSGNNVRERFILRLRLKKTKRNKYEVVKFSSKTISEQTPMFCCWFCGRMFNNQEEWIGHGQRHLMEATRDWNKLF